MRRVKLPCLPCSQVHAVRSHANQVGHRGDRAVDDRRQGKVYPTVDGLAVGLDVHAVVPSLERQAGLDVLTLPLGELRHAHRPTVESQAVLDPGRHSCWCPRL